MSHLLILHPLICSKKVRLMKRSRFKLGSIVFVAVLFLCSQTVARACDMIWPDVKIRCLAETIEMTHSFLEVYVVDKEFSTNPQLAPAVAKDRSMLQKLEPCYDELASVVALQQEAYVAIHGSVDWTGVFQFTPIQDTSNFNDESVWYQVNSCLFPWRMANDKWLATTSTVKSYCTGELMESAGCQNTVQLSWTRFALEVAGLRETNMPESVRQRFRPFVGDPFVFIAQHRTEEEEQTTVDISALRTSLANLRATIEELTHPAMLTATTTVTEPVAVAVVPSTPIRDEPSLPTPHRWWSRINLFVIGLLLVLTVVELVLLLRRRFTL